MSATPPQALHQRESDDVLDQRMIDWLVWKVLLPLTIIVFIWPAYKYVAEFDHPFERAFAHGDLLIFSALVLIEATIEGERQHGHRRLMRTGLQVLKVVAIAFIFFFGFIKYDVMVRERTAAQAEAQAAVKKVEAEQRRQAQEQPAQPPLAEVLQAEAQLAESSKAAEEHLMTKMLAYSYFNCTVAAVSVIFSVFAFWWSVSAEKNRLYEKFKRGNSESGS
jgi:Sec-independent protein translocase protein TatA